MQTFTPLNGSFTKKGNYVWGGGLTLSWKQLIQDIIKQPIRLRTQDKSALDITSNFNNSPFNNKMLSQSCCYFRAGFGNQTAHKINQQVNKKFPQKTTPKIQPNLSSSGIISYAYFFKKMKFEHPFAKADVSFKENIVTGFEAKSLQQRNQVHIHKYKDSNNFIIQLQTKAENDEIFCIKSSSNLNPEQILQNINGLTNVKSVMGKKDLFKMPKIKLNIQRNVKQLMVIYNHKQIGQKIYNQFKIIFIII